MQTLAPYYTPALTNKGAAPYIGVEPRQVGKMIRDGLLAGTRTSPRGRYRTTLEAVQRYLAGLPASPSVVSAPSVPPTP